MIGTFLASRLLSHMGLSEVWLLVILAPTWCGWAIFLLGPTLRLLTVLRPSAGVASALPSLGSADATPLAARGTDVTPLADYATPPPP